MKLLWDNLSWRVIPPKKIVKNGIYKFIRHPMYLGALLLYMGLFLLITKSWSISILANIFTINFIVDRIDREEQLMLMVFGKEYYDYMKKTKIIIPFVW